MTGRVPGRGLSAVLGLAGLAAFSGAAGVAALAWLTAEQIIRRRAPDPPANPAELGLPFEPVSLTSRKTFPGRPLPGTEGTSAAVPLGGWLVPASGTARGSVIFCSGQAGSLDPDLQYVPAFHRHGFDVLQFDWRAHGRSGGEQASMGYFERLDLLAAVDWLVARGARRVGLLGFSMGGAVALSAAALQPDVAAVAVDGAFARVEPTVAGGIRARGLPAWLARPVAALAVDLAGRRLGCDLRAADPLHWIGRLSPRPVLLVHAERDEFVPPDDIQRLYAAAGQPKTLWIAPGAGHRCIDSLYPDQYLPRLLAFFEHALGELPQP